MMKCFMKNIEKTSTTVKLKRRAGTKIERYIPHISFFKKNKE